MKVLTLREPWASLIGENIKLVETRSWPTSYRGELYIHAGLTKIPANNKRMNDMKDLLKGSLHYGNIFLKCKLTDCIEITENLANEYKKANLTNFLCGDYTAGRFAWILSDVEYIEEIPAKGHLSIWNYDN